MSLSLNRSFVLILYIQYMAHYCVNKIIRKHTKLNHNHPNCFTNDTLNWYTSMLCGIGHDIFEHMPLYKFKKK